MITTEQYQSIPNETKSLYKETNDGYILSSISNDEVLGLKNNKDNLIQEKRDLKEKLDALEAQVSEEQQHKLEEQGNYKTLLETTKADFEDKLQKEQERSQSFKEQLQSNIMTSTLLELTDKLTDNPSLLSPHLQTRLLINDDNQLVILDADGNTTSNTIDSLVTEFRESETFKPLVKQEHVPMGSGATPPEAGSQNIGIHSELDKFFNPTSSEFNLGRQVQIKTENPEAYELLYQKYNSVGNIFDIFNATKPQQSKR